LEAIHPGLGGIIAPMFKLVIGTALLICAFAAMPPWRRADATPQQSNVRALNDRARAITLSITAGGGPFGPPKDRYNVGQRIPISITMTNTSDHPIQVCVSGTLYQDQPRLSRNGQPLAYSQALMPRASQVEASCLEDDLPDPIVLHPKESRVVDWFILAEGSNPTGDIAWYEPLQAGKYELMIQRRLDCCDGPTITSNKISFEVVP
jgi:hypothetical protein